eukprot:CAMPEP_0197838416 /NCGR_PEP_ID=MMETSP1437-20131217/36222_1 /TAXON_ID=49252 ORGANISM="Eucampia antarctica, Strain CCMP1452" /NCGR_SAMPLE_ID=MMETSP1437 /ASSEMBLY_ACC=CAM_ASM_001096 /LENGTH=63 /DNA_ID=CAMNT_0043446323 /DNA_START=232 /DNA_END=420 /DNA_ORIENTATION=+
MTGSMNLLVLSSIDLDLSDTQKLGFTPVRHVEENSFSNIIDKSAGFTSPLSSGHSFAGFGELN